jgi:hypothetical protein
VLRLLVAALSLGLSGCWIGDGLFVAGDARPVIAAGSYRLTAPGEQAAEGRVTIRPDGLTSFAGPDGDEVYGFAPLAADPSRFIGWMASKDDDRLQIYFLAARKPGGSLTIYLPRCSGADGDLARRAGAEVEQGSAPSCRFRNRAAIEAALQALHPADSELATLERLPDS